MRGGRLKDAKIVNESLRAKSAKLDKGTDRHGFNVEVCDPNILVN